MNDHSYTYLSSRTKYFSSIDLSFCYPSLFLYINWSVCKDQNNSDHVPLIIDRTRFPLRTRIQGAKNRANWDISNTLCTCKLIPENFKKSSDPKSDFTCSLVNTSKECK